MARTAFVNPDMSAPFTGESSITSEEGYAEIAKSVVSPDNDELQSELDAQRAFNDAPDVPLQPYTRGSDAYRNDLVARKAKLDGDISLLEGQRNGMNARIDDMNMERNAVSAGLAVLK